MYQLTVPARGNVRHVGDEYKIITAPFNGLQVSFPA